MLLVGSYIKLVKKPYESFPVDTSMLGKIIQIEKDNILVQYPMMNMGMSFDEFAKYFTTVETPEDKIRNSKRTFTSWKIMDISFDHSGFRGEFPPLIWEYCTNGKVVKVRRHYTPGLKKDREILVGKASCCEEDIFDLLKGIHLAYARCRTKEVKKNIDEFNKKLHYYNSDCWMF